jgi:hypothetical protein
MGKTMKMYIAVLDEFPDYMTPALVAHAVLGAHLTFKGDLIYDFWLNNSFKKCVVRVNQKEFDKISVLGAVYLGFEKNTLDGKVSVAVVRPYPEDKDIPNVLRFAKLWSPK